MDDYPDQTPKTAKLNTPPVRRPNKESRTREYLTTNEIDSLRQAARSEGRHPHRDDTLILLMFRHGLRISEVASLRWEQIDLQNGMILVNRLKNGLPANHPLRGIEIRALRKLKRDYPKTPYVFTSERRAPLATRSIHHIINRAGERANLGISVHPHMLRHSTGFYLASDGHDTRAIQGYLGHANIKNTVIYMELSPNRFKRFWTD